ncbi:MAG: glycosyltransferase family 39 protein, partial [Deltaproteobacteria bacterium]|nr:glycosyltransferase family 39 protein [Deltaproteobacteria bacterium]
NLYSDFVDNKPPFIYLFYLISQFIPGEDIRAVHILTTVLIIPLIAFFTSLTIKKINRTAGLLAGLFYIVFTSAYIPTDMLATNCEIIMILFASTGFLFLIQNTNIGYFLYGIFISLATLSKQHAAIWILVPMISSLLLKDNNTIKKLLLSLTGFFIPFLFCMFYFYANGNLDNFIYFTIGHNIGYSKNPVLVSEIFKRFIKYLLPFLIIISPLIFFYLKSRKNTDKLTRSIFEPTLILSIFMIFIGFRFFPHYFIQSVYPLSILAACYFANPEQKKISIRFIIAYSVVLTILFNSYTFIYYSKKTDFIEETEPLLRSIPGMLKEEGYCSNKNRYLFIWGYAPLFYYYFYKECSMLPASRFVLPQASTAGYIPGNESQLKGSFDFEKYIIKEHRRLLIEDLMNKNPQIIIDTSKSNFHNWKRYTIDKFPELNKFISENYLLYRNTGGFDIYVRK